MRLFGIVSVFVGLFSSYACLGIAKEPLSTIVHANVFYQPQVGDQTIPREIWQKNFQKLKGQGAKTLIIQWTQYDQITFNGPEGWIKKIIVEAQKVGLETVVGLYWDSEFFSWSKESLVNLEKKLHRYFEINLALAGRWEKALADQTIEGWYLPAEFGDAAWGSLEKRDVLKKHLKQFQNDLQALNLVMRPPGSSGFHPPSVGISSFFSGAMEPVDYANWLQDLAEKGWFIWIQDGSGTGMLDAKQRLSYLSAFFNCPAQHSFGLTVEAFRQTGGFPFQARPATPEELTEALNDYQNYCLEATSLFELRYLSALSH